jgi:hypothetical protein
MKNKINAFLIALMLCTPMLALNGCTKESSSEESNLPEKISPEKLARVKKYISIMWVHDIKSIDDVKYDPIKDEFTFGPNVISRVKLEHYYDIANEYKARHEQ